MWLIYDGIYNYPIKHGIKNCTSDLTENVFRKKKLNKAVKELKPQKTLKTTRFVKFHVTEKILSTTHIDIEFILKNSLHFRAYSNKNSNLNPQNIRILKITKVECLHSRAEGEYYNGDS